MILDRYGRLIPETTESKPASGMQIVMQPLTDREGLDVSRGLTPRDVDRILVQANGGDVEAQCRLSRELPEKSPAVAHALRTRRNALTGCRWHIEPGDGSTRATEAARRLKNDLDAAGTMHPKAGRLWSFSQLLAGLTDAVLPGFAAAEIVWRPGGLGFYGFRPVEQRFFSFTKSYSPRLRTTGHLYEGEEPGYGKLVFHALHDGIDPVRGGLIRPLAWLFCFSQINHKDLLSFIERYGMPFVRATVDQATWEKEKVTLNDLISNFGPRGGGVFSRNVEVELLQAASTTGDVYFRLLEYLDDAITKVLLGQTASSGDSSGLSGGDAQSEVRHDILAADARALEETVNRDLFAVWMRCNYPPGVPSPRLLIETEPPEDEKAAAEKNLILAQTIQSLAAVGYKADVAAVSKMFGLPLTYEPPQQGGPDGFGPAVPAQAAAPAEPAPAAETLAPDKKAVMYGTLIRGGVLTPTRDLEERVRAELGLDPLPEEAAKLWDEAGGVRKPLTLKDPAEPPPETGQVGSALELAELPDKPDRSDLSDALEELFGPAADAADRIVEILDDETLSEEERRERLRGIELEITGGSGMETLMTREMEKRYAEGKNRGK
ncbi:DUF935 family protein [uncultured Victivallis sp.]|uniref:phage portal protein family protein n=1 Tax=uncultured Victivallis sp. TaxID=354118 RepID=UPI002597F097|nr:DUF935 family protein [uncultured Victivallis sp.]